MSIPAVVKYVDMYEGRGVYLYSDGTNRHDPTDTPLTRCKFCNGFTSYHGTKQCNGCWEVSGRLQKFLLSPIARDFTKELIKTIEETVGR